MNSKKTSYISGMEVTIHKLKTLVVALPIVVVLSSFVTYINALKTPQKKEVNCVCMVNVNQQGKVISTEWANKCDLYGWQHY